MLLSIQDWTTAIHRTDFVKIKRLLVSEPNLLWTPLFDFADDNLKQQLVQLHSLGSQFEPFYALHFAMLLQDFRLISFLIKSSLLYDLDTKFWGQCNNTTLHLACFLNQQAIVDLLLVKGVSLRANDLGYYPTDINHNIKMAVDDKRFVVDSLEQKKTEHEYFRNKKILETQQKLTGESISQLMEQSLYKQFEKISLEADIYSNNQDSESQIVLNSQANILEPIYNSNILSGETIVAKDRQSKEMKRRSGSQKAAWTMSISSWAAILDREFNLNDLNPALLTLEQEKNTQDLPVRSEPTTIPRKATNYIPNARIGGKLCLRIHKIQDILLPTPKSKTFVRCVVSDGHFEYMSRYEILSQDINFNYECTIDTHPNMIITLSLHVRPDYITKSRSPFSRLFTSRKKKESLSSYINKEDGAIGQSRFSLDLMLSACYEDLYQTDLSCFNSWYSRSFKEYRKQKRKEDVLKVVANFNTSMVYLPPQNQRQN